LNVKEVSYRFALIGLHAALSFKMKRPTMRRISLGATLVASLLLGGEIMGIAAPNPRLRITDDSSAPSVDVELIIAVDVSHSMTIDELAVQREGYAEAIHSSEFLQAVQAGPNSKISIIYFEWSASNDQRIIVPWRMIDGPETADAVANEIMKIPVQRGTHTSISGAILFALPLFDQDPYRGARRVIDISGDGPNNSGSPIAPARDRALAKGVVINGLPIMMNEYYSSVDINNLDWYYEDCVIGGPGSFMIPINSREGFKQAILTKLLREIASKTPERRVRTASDMKPRVNCTIQDKIFEDR
jgi:hypothetical protein